jgi:phytoene synthase
MLPERVRIPATGLYAFCRIADDAIDRERQTEALSALRRRLDLVYRGQPQDHPVDRAFADAVLGFSIPANIPHALLEGFAWDVANRRYRTFAGLQAYAVRVAGTVGVMMALLMNARDQALLARACDLGVAMQLTNIARDVGEDARNGRLYLPLDWLREEGLDPLEWLARPNYNAALGRVIERLLLAADELYRAAETGIGQLPASCRPGMRAARLLYQEIGREVARRSFDSVNERAVVSWRRKGRIFAQAIVGARHATAPRTQRRALVARVEQRVAWLIELFERLERAERPSAGAVHS